MASRVKSPIDLILGEPDFDITGEIKREGIRAIEEGFNKYTLTQGIPELREKIEGYLGAKEVKFERVMATAGVTGGCCYAV